MSLRTMANLAVQRDLKVVHDLDAPTAPGATLPGAPPPGGPLPGR